MADKFAVVATLTESFMSSACFTLSTYDLVAASVLDEGVATFCNLLDPKSTVCEPATVSPASKSAEAPKVGVPVTVIASLEALPKVIAPFNAVAPETVKSALPVISLVTAKVPATVVLPEEALTVNLLEAMLIQE